MSSTLRDESFDVLSESFNAMADSLQNRINELAELSQMQQRFVSDVSHELRTPLTTIRLAGDVLYSQRDNLDTLGARTGCPNRPDFSPYAGDGRTLQFAAVRRAAVRS